VRKLPVSIRPEAIEDLQNIQDWIESESGDPEIAEAFVTRIFDRCESLGDFPMKGRRRDD